MNESTTVPSPSSSRPSTAGEPLRLVVAAGGTGGHIFPAIATLEALRSTGPLDVTWIGGANGFEARIATQHGIPFHAIPVGKLRRYVAWQTIPDAVRIPLGILKAWRLLGHIKPDVVLSTGGYASVPTVVAARLRRVPVLTHEQTVTVGLATKINARVADVVALSWPSSAAGVGKPRGEVIVTGNPLRALIANGDANRGRKSFGLPAALPLLYATGGIQGATSINRSIIDNLPALLEHVVIVHQCGSLTERDDVAALRGASSSLPAALANRYRQRETLGDEVGDVLAAAALVVARSGAGTIAELAATGTPSILVPLPGADEQRRNARLLADAGAAMVIPDEEMTGERLRSTIESLLADPAQLARMSAAARSLAQDAPAERLASAIRALASR